MGVSRDVGREGATGTPQYRFWTEDYPENEIWEGPIIRPGDEAYVVTEYRGNGKASYLLANTTTGEYQTFANAAPYDCPHAADFINERYGPHYLPNFGSVPMSFNAFGNESEALMLSRGHNHELIMTSNCEATGKVLSAPGEVSNHDFSQYWYARSPVCN